MYNILFICYGNICRSPMAEMIFKDLIYKNNKKYLFKCESKSTSMEEIGNDIYPSLVQGGDIYFVTQTTKEDYNKYDLIICKEKNNYYDLINIYNGDPEDKIKLLMDYTGRDEEIEDPWYTGNFDKVFNQIKEGCEDLFDYLVDKSHSEEN